MHRPTQFSPSLGVAVKVASLALAAASVAACSDSTSPRDPVAIVQFVNAAQPFATADLTIDNTLAVNDLPYAHTGAAFYAKVLSTPRTFRAYSGTNTTVLASLDLTPVKNETYTLVLTEHTEGGAGFLLLPDTVTAPAAGKIKLRVVNVARSAGAVDVYVTDLLGALGTPQKVSVPFEGSSDYIEVNASLNERVRITAAGHPETILLDTDDSLLDLNLQAGGAATVLLMESSTGGSPYRALYVTDRI